MNKKDSILQLITNCKKGETQSEYRLYDELYTLLFRLASSYTQDKEFAQDVVQETFIIIFEHLNQWEESRGNFTSWCCAILRNKCFNLYKKQKKWEYQCDYPAYLATNDDCTMDHSLLLDDVLTITKNLSIRQRKILVANVKGYNHDEIGKMLNIAPSSSRASLSRIRNTIRKEVAV